MGAAPVPPSRAAVVVAILGILISAQSSLALARLIEETGGDFGAGPTLSSRGLTVVVGAWILGSALCWVWVRKRAPWETVLSVVGLAFLAPVLGTLVLLAVTLLEHETWTGLVVFWLSVAAVGPICAVRLVRAADLTWWRASWAVGSAMIMFLLALPVVALVTMR